VYGSCRAELDIWRQRTRRGDVTVEGSTRHDAGQGQSVAVQQKLIEFLRDFYGNEDVRLNKVIMINLCL